MTETTIGVLGGAGVWASIALVSRITELVSRNGARFDQDHPELVMIQATQAPSRSMYLEGRGPSFLPAYVDAAVRLRQSGAGFIAMACNTAHALRSDIEDAAQIRILDMIDLAAQQAVDHVGQKGCIGILSSSGSQKIGLYEKALKQLAPGIKMLDVDASVQGSVTEGIIAVKRGHHLSEATIEGPQRAFAQAAQSLVDRGADAVILGCTEIPLAFPVDWQSAAVVDTIDLLARASLREAGFNSSWV